MERSESIKSLAAALALFHVKMSKIKKDASNPFFNSTYATLSNILEHIATPLQEAGLIFTQLPDGDALTTLIIHIESGECIKSTYNISAIRKDPQSIGSAITYARRYALSAILGLNVDTDDDGNKASQPDQKQQVEAKDDGKQWLSQKQYEAALSRICNGEPDLFEKIKAEFKMKKEYNKSLYEAYNLNK